MHNSPPIPAFVLRSHGVDSRLLAIELTVGGDYQVRTNEMDQALCVQEGAANVWPPLPHKMPAESLRTPSS
jgi:hypothetical protein